MLRERERERYLCSGIYEKREWEKAVGVFTNLICEERGWESRWDVCI